MKNSLWPTLLLLFVFIMPSNLIQTHVWDGSQKTTTGLTIPQGNREWRQKVPAAQEATPGPTGTLEAAYPIEPGTSTLGLIIGALIIVLTVLGGVIYASLMQRRN